MTALCCVAALPFASCDCGSTDGNGGGDDDTAAVDDDTHGDQDDDDDANDDLDDDTWPDDDFDDDTIDDDTDDGENDDDSGDDDTWPHSDLCYWNTDLPPDDAYEWKVTEISDKDDVLGSRALAFDNQGPVVFFVKWDVQLETTIGYFSRLKQGGSWELTRFSNPDYQGIASMGVAKSPTGEIALTIAGLGWSPDGLSVCRFEGETVGNCIGVWDGVRWPIFSGFTPDGRYTALARDPSDIVAVYLEQLPSGIWAWSMVPTLPFTVMHSFAMGSDGIGHTTYPDGAWEQRGITHAFGGPWQVWQTEVVYVAGDSVGSSFAVSRQNDMIAEVNHNNAILFIARDDLGQWVSEPLTGPGPQSSYWVGRVAFDSETRPMATYQVKGWSDPNNWSYLCWARKEAGGWRKEEVFGVRVGYVYDMATDTDGNIGILFYFWDDTEEKSKLAFAFRTALTR
ncbi:hypothetical protein K8I61_09365 [bacterium]|nr:hypothetical protein [bacterium]